MAPRAAFEAARQLQQRAEQAVQCASCGGTRLPTPLYCVPCNRHLCGECAGGPHRTVCALVRCDACQAILAGEHDLINSITQRLGRLELQQQTSMVLRWARRESTMAVHRRAHRALQEYATIYGALALPASELQLAHFLVWMLCLRDPTLYVATVELYSSVISEWHNTCAAVTELPLANPCSSQLIRTLLRSARRGLKRVARRKEPYTAPQLVRILHAGFDLTTVGGLHDRLLFCFCLFGPLRRGVTTNLTVDYTVRNDPCDPLGLRVTFTADSKVKIRQDVIEVTVDIDKNVNAANRRTVHIPPGIFGVDTPHDLLFYLKVCRPPSGGTLFASAKCPRQKLPQRVTPNAFSFNTNAFTASCELNKRAFKRAFELAEKWELDLFGGCSPRKTLAQLLWATTGDRRVVVDFGGWAIGKDESAVDSYFHLTTAQRIRILQGLLQKLLDVGELSTLDAEICGRTA